MLWLCLSCERESRGLRLCLSTFHFTSTEVVVVGLMATIIGGSSGTGIEKETEKKTNGTHRTVCFLDVLQKSTPRRRHHARVHRHRHTHSHSVIDPSLSPSCRVVTASVSLLRILSPISLVASIRNLYDVKGFRLKDKQTLRHMYMQQRTQKKNFLLLVLLRLFKFVCLLCHHTRQCVHHIQMSPHKQLQLY